MKYILYFCVLVSLVHHGLTTLFGEAEDLNSLLNYETVDDLNEQSENWQDDALTDDQRRSLCENSQGLESIERNEYTIDCTEFKYQIPEKEVREKRDVELEEGSGDDQNIETTQISVKEDAKAETTIVPKVDLKQVVVTQQSNELGKENADIKEEPKTEKTDDKAVTGDPKKDAEFIHRGKTLLSGDKNMESKHDLPNDSESDKSIRTDGSTKKAGSEDTTILIVLFVAVVAVGVVAFAYNFIKKRKQQRADLEVVEKGSIKRSIQNLTKVGERLEDKPLIEEESEVEMVDMKQPNGDSVKPNKEEYSPVSLNEEKNNS